MNLNYLKKNKISVCIPTYNNVEGLLALLGSLQNQTIFKDLNILIQLRESSLNPCAHEKPPENSGG